MLKMRVGDHEMPYIEVGRGKPLVCIHGSLGDFRVWMPVLGPLSKHYRVISPSLRHFFPEHWDGKGGKFTIGQHVADVIAFIEGLGAGKVHLMGHSRGGHIAFRVAQVRPDLIDKLILAEPGGELDASLLPPGETPSTGRVQSIIDAAELIGKGEVEAGLTVFVDRIDGEGTWRRRPDAVKQRLRDNARTLIGQINEQRQPFRRAEAEAIELPTLFILGGQTKGFLPITLRALASAMPNAKTVVIPNTTHPMFEQAPMTFTDAVIEFLGRTAA